MKDLDRTVSMKLPAQVISTNLAKPVEVWTAPYHRKTELTAQVNRAAARRQIRPLTSYPVYSPDRGLWEHRVVRIKDAPPAWRKPLLITVAVLTALGVLGALGYWVISTLATLPLGLFLAAALVVMVMIMRSGRQPSVQVTTHVNTQVRVR